MLEVKQLAFDFSLVHSPTLDNFVAGRNAELVARLRGLASVKPDERLLYLWGPPGSGRTHLLRATALLLDPGGARVAYIACSRETPLPDRLLERDVIAIDDVERLDEAGQVSFFNLY